MHAEDRLNTLAALWSAWCAQSGYTCRDAAEMAVDQDLPGHVRAMAQQFVALWDDVADMNA